MAKSSINYWLVKSDPDTYDWDDFVKEGKTSWDGVRNFAARNHLKAMKKGDEIFFYHSGGESMIVGLATLSREYYQDPTSDVDTWVSVEIKAGKKLSRGITLSEIKSVSKLKEMMLIKISRLSVMPVSEEEFKTILEISEK